jgi:hypothetical protein
MTRRIHANGDTLLRQAWMTAAEYMMHGKRAIDEAFGAGYGAKHPELLAAHMQTAGAVLSSFFVASSIEDLSESVEANGEILSRAVDGLAEATGEKGGYVSSSIDDLAAAVKESGNAMANQLKWFGTGDAIGHEGPMGAFDFLGTCVKEAAESMAATRQIADSVDRHG